MTPRRIQKLKVRIARPGYWQKRYIQELRSLRYWMEESALKTEHKEVVMAKHWAGRFAKRAMWYWRKFNDEEQE